MHVNPDQAVIWQYGFIKLNTTILTTWIWMLSMAVIAKLATRRISAGIYISRRQHFLEMIVTGIRQRIGATGLQQPVKYLPFLGTLFFFIAGAGLCTFIGSYVSPMASPSTVTALVICIIGIPPFFRIKRSGWKARSAAYRQTAFMLLPFIMIRDFFRTLALTILYLGNIMSGMLIVCILLAAFPLFFPGTVHAFGMFTGLAQAYVISILAALYIEPPVKGDTGIISQTVNVHFRPMQLPDKSHNLLNPEKNNKKT